MGYKEQYRKIAETILDILFPKFCVSCGKEGRYLCTECNLFMSEANFICPSCQEAAFLGKKHKTCRDKGLDGLINFWDYEGIVKKLIREAKEDQLVGIYQEMLESGVYCMKTNKERFSEFLSFLLDKETTISFIPKEKKKFNYGEEIAKNLSQIFKKEIMESGGKQVVLIDDTWISGETLKKHARKMKEEGAEKVWGFTLARTP